MVRLVTGRAGSSIVWLVGTESQWRSKTIWQFLNERSQQNLFIFAHKQSDKIRRNVFFEFKVTVICKFSREIISHHFYASQQRFHITVSHTDARKQCDVRKRIVSWVESDLGTGRVPKCLKLFLKRSPARGAEVENKSSGNWLVLGLKPIFINKFKINFIGPG